MSKTFTNRLVPELRFLEFTNDTEWQKKILAKISSSIFDGTHQTPRYVENGIPFFSVENLVSGNKNKFISREDYLEATRINKPEKGDILLTRIGTIGFSVVVDWDYEFSIYVTLAVIKKSDHFHSFFLHSFFQSDYYRKEILSKSLLDAVPCKINMDELRKTSVILPPTIREQQKIAECLTSVDDLIAAQRQKVEALKAHKKGLLQQLFPGEGENVPNLGFLEFEGDGEWKEKSLDSVCESFSGGTPTTTEKGYYGGNIPFIRSAEIAKKTTELFLTELGLKNSSAKLIKKGDVLVALYGANSGDVALAQIDGAINQAILCLRSYESNAFIYHFLTLRKNWIIKSFLQGGQGNLSGEIVKSIKLQFPILIEQQKIADCLSSIDELIIVQDQKLEALMTHKKGLMQGLFPNINQLPNE